MTAAGLECNCGPFTESSPGPRNPNDDLLHALYQPLTGLQCSLELASNSSELPDRYVQMLNESLELVGRIRVLVEALRQLREIEQNGATDGRPLALDGVVRELVLELTPVAATKRVQLDLANESPLWVRPKYGRMQSLMFQLLDSVLCLAAFGSVLEVKTAADRDTARIVISWEAGELPEYSPFSRPELGILVAIEGLERAGASCTQRRAANTCQCGMEMILSPHFENKESEVRS